jgi:hypothetical protein
VNETEAVSKTLREGAMAETATLVGGPQDGAKVRKSGGDEGHPYMLPDVLYVGPKWLGDGFAAWSRGPSKRFPARYLRHARDTGNFYFDCFIDPQITNIAPTEATPEK